MSTATTITMIHPPLMAWPVSVAAHHTVREQK